MIQTSSGDCRPVAGAAAAAASSGTSVSDSSSEASTAVITAAASGWYIRPSMPVIPNSGANTATTIKVA